MGKWIWALCAGLLLSGCTHGSVSSLPVHTAEHGDVYRYQGRANFGHQIAEADKMIIAHCARVNGGRPVVLNVQKQYLGDVAIGNSSATTTGSAVASGGIVHASATTTGSGAVSTLRNYNQDVMFKCVPNAKPARK